MIAKADDLSKRAVDYFLIIGLTSLMPRPIAAIHQMTNRFS
jgi:hypothetical protein